MIERPSLVVRKSERLTAKSEKSSRLRNARRIRYRHHTPLEANLRAMTASPYFASSAGPFSLASGNEPQWPTLAQNGPISFVHQRQSGKSTIAAQNSYSGLLLE